MENSEITQDPRFRRAVRMGEYTRAISIYLRIQHPEREDLSILPREIIQGVQVAVDNAFFAKAAERKELEEEFR